MDELRVGDAIGEIFTLLRRSNKYIDETTPWVLGKDETKKERLATVLYNLRAISESQTAEKILDMLDTQQRSLQSLERFGNLECGHSVVKKAEILFARIDAEEFRKQLEADREQEEAAARPAKPQITFDDFGKLELKVGTVIACEKHPKADRLLVEQIDLGNETRQIVSGIASHFAPEEMVGRRVVVVTNLKPGQAARRGKPGHDPVRRER